MFFLLTFDTQEERDKFTVLYQEYREYMIRAAEYLLRDHADAEDLVHDVFIEIAEHLDKINLSERGKTRSYLAIFVTHRSIDRLRQKKDTVPLEEAANRIRVAESWDGASPLSEAIARLPENLKEILMLHYAFGYSYREIAEMLEETPKAIYRKVRLAKDRLAEILKEEEKE